MGSLLSLEGQSNVLKNGLSQGPVELGLVGVKVVVGNGVKGGLASLLLRGRHCRFHLVL